MNDIELSKVYGSYRGGASYLLNTIVPTSEYMYCIINNTSLVTYMAKYSGIAYIYVPTATATYRIHEAAASNTSIGARVIGMEIQHVDPTHFRFNYVLGSVTSTIPTITDRYSDGRTHLYGTWYKIAWYINRNGTGDAFWVNNVSGAVSIPNKNETFILSSQRIMNGGTPAGFKLNLLLTTTDPTIDEIDMSNLFSNNTNKAPVYLGSGAVTQNGKTRSCYIDCGTPQIMNHATGQPFEHKTPAAPVNYSHVMDRCVIA